MAHNYAQLTSEQESLTGMDKLEYSIAACEELMASLQTAKHPSAGRTKYLLGVRLAKIRQRLEQGDAGETGN